MVEYVKINNLRRGDILARTVYDSNTYREEIALTAPLVDDLLQLKIVALLKEIFANTGIITDHFNNEFQKQRNLMDEFRENFL